MTTLSLSDLSQMLQLRRDTVRIRTGLATATQELSSGKKADLGRATSGNFAPLVALDRQISALAGYQTNATEAASFMEMAQSALERVRTVAGDLGLRLADAGQADLATLGAVFATEAEGHFSVVVSALNTSVAGRSVFGGAATDRAPLAPASEMLAELRGLVAGQDTAAGVIAVVETWFAPGGGFDTGTAGYQGSDQPLTGFRVSEGRQIAMPVRADDPVLRDQLKSLALGAMLEGSNITDSAERVALAEAAGQAIVSNQSRVVSLQAQVGSAQARIETANAANSAEGTALKIARNEIVLADPEEVVARLKGLEVQLQTIYTITARLSGLSLTNYLR